MVDDPEKNTLEDLGSKWMHARHTVKKRKTFNESKILSLVNGRMVAATRKSGNRNVGRKVILEMNLKWCPCKNVEKVIGNIGLYVEKTARVSFFNIENWTGWLKSFDFQIPFGKEYIWGHGSKKIFFFKCTKAKNYFFVPILALSQKFNICFHAIFIFKRLFGKLKTRLFPFNIINCIERIHFRRNLKENTLA